MSDSSLLDLKIKNILNNHLIMSKLQSVIYKSLNSDSGHFHCFPTSQADILWMGQYFYLCMRRIAHMQNQWIITNLRKNSWPDLKWLHSWGLSYKWNGIIYPYWITSGFTMCCRNTCKIEKNSSQTWIHSEIEFFLLKLLNNC